FGELGRDSQSLASRTAPRTFYVHPNTALAFGAGVQAPDSGIACDLAGLELRCPGQEPLVRGGADLLAGETGSGELAWYLHPQDLRSQGRQRARLGAGRRAVDVRLAWPDTSSLRREDVPHAPSGLAAGSLRQLGEPPPAAYARLVASAGDGDALVLVLAPAAARLRVTAEPGGFAVRAAAGQWHFAVSSRRGAILARRS
ncbi:MAG: hypothetical protein ABIL09_22415, partial [Gemmatimonadota bacterium]